MYSWWGGGGKLCLFTGDGARFAGYLFHPGALRAIAGGACGGRNGARSQRRAAGRNEKMGTVGAVARDKFGNLAAATSTGGMTNKLPGRVGDSPLVGAGCYANNASVAVSCTGTGEVFIRTLAAYDIAALMEYGGLSLADACERVVMEKLPALGGSGGLIAVDHEGNVALPFNSEGMYRAWGYAGDTPTTGIYRE